MRDGSLRGPGLSRLRALVSLLLTLALWPGGASAHKFYASLAQIEKTADGRIEVGIRLFPDDLEQALSLAEGRRVVIGNTRTFQDALMKYLGPALALESGADRARFRYVGIDPKVNLLWVFVEADWTRPLKGSRLINRLLLEVSGDQINTVNLTEGDAKETLTFTSVRVRADVFAPKAK